MTFNIINRVAWGHFPIPADDLKHSRRLARNHIYSTSLILNTLYIDDGLQFYLTDYNHIKGTPDPSCWILSNKREINYLCIILRFNLGESNFHTWLMLKHLITTFPKKPISTLGYIFHFSLSTFFPIFNNFKLFLTVTGFELLFILKDMNLPLPELSSSQDQNNLWHYWMHQGGAQPPSLLQPTETTITWSTVDI